MSCCLIANMNSPVFFLFFPRDIMNNKVFYQHPNLMRILGMHETVMEVMVNVLGGDKSQVSHLLHLLLVTCARILIILTERPVGLRAKS